MLGPFLASMSFERSDVSNFQANKQGNKSTFTRSVAAPENTRVVENWWLNYRSKGVQQQLLTLI